MSQVDMLSINAVAAKLGLSVHQLRRWELMFGLEIKRGRGQQRQYRSEDMSVLERIKELVEQGWPTSQIRPQLEAEGLVTPKLIGMPPPPGNPEVLSEALIGFRNFTERRFIEISKQIDELRQLLISITLKQELSGEPTSPWQPVQREFAPEPKATPPQEISIGPDFSAGPPVEFTPPPPPPQRTSIIGAPTPPKESTFEVGPSSFSTPPTSFSTAPAPSERRSIIGEPSAPPPPAPMPPASLGMSEDEADALLDEEDIEDEEIAEEEVAAPPPPPAPVEVKETFLDENVDEDEDEFEDEEEEEQPQTATPTITPVSSSSVFGSGSPASTTTSGAFSPVSAESSAAPPAPPAAPADPFKSSPFLSAPPAAPESPPAGRAPEPSLSEPPSPQDPGSSFAPSAPSLTASSAGDMFSSVIQSANDAASRDSEPEPTSPPKPPDDVPFFSSTTGAPPPPVPPSPPVPGPGGTPFTPPGAESSPFIPTPPASSSSPFLTPPPAPYMSGAAPQPQAQPFEPTAPPEPESAPQAPPAPPEAPKAPAPQAQKGPFLGEITDQNYLTILGRALDLVGWSDEQADGFSVSRFKVPHWDELGRSQAEVLIEHLLSELQSQMSPES